MAEPLRNFYTPQFLGDVANCFTRHWNKFPAEQFLSVFKSLQWTNAELKTRVGIISTSLKQCLPADYKKAIDILVPASQEISAGYFGVFFPDYVERFGLHDWDTSLHALEWMTRTSTGEFAIRHFILKDPQRAMRQMLKWSMHENHHVRRLASEGCRPKLPWGIRLQQFVNDPAPILPVLQNLKADNELYVRKSVANNLNDISKDHPDLVLKIANDWMGNNPNTNWVVRHAVRTLFKRGNGKAMKLFGVKEDVKCDVNFVSLFPKKLRIGDYLQFAFDVNLDQGNQPIRIEYGVAYLKSNGSHSIKKFFVAEKKFHKGLHHFTRKQSFRDMTTRKHYAGRHHLIAYVNGKEKASVAFSLSV